jgi:DNA-binding NarL/FixJ family response regulator
MNHISAEASPGLAEGAPPMQTRILLVDDHQIVRKGLRVILEQEPNFQVVGEAADGVEAVDLATRLEPDVVLMDISLPSLNGIDATRRILDVCPTTRVVALTAHAMHDMISGTFRAGAVGYLVKDSAVEELVQAVRTVVAGGVYVSPRVAGTVVGQFVGGTARPASRSAARRPAGRSTGSPTASGRCSADERGVRDEGGRPGAGREHQDGRDAPPGDHGEARPAQRGRADEVRDPRGADDACEGGGGEGG